MTRNIHYENALGKVRDEIAALERQLIEKKGYRDGLMDGMDALAKDIKAQTPPQKEPSDAAIKWSDQAHRNGPLTFQQAFKDGAKWGSGLNEPLHAVDLEQDNLPHSIWSHWRSIMRKALALVVILPLLPFILLGKLMGWALSEIFPYRG